jgi:hypothetical protein
MKMKLPNGNLAKNDKENADTPHVDIPAILSKISKKTTMSKLGNPQQEFDTRRPQPRQMAHHYYPMPPQEERPFQPSQLVWHMSQGRDCLPHELNFELKTPDHNQEAWLGDPVRIPIQMQEYQWHFCPLLSHPNKMATQSANMGPLC